MSMNDVRAELFDCPPQFRNLPKITHNPLSVYTKIPAFDALFFNGLHLLRDEWSVMAIFKTGNDQNTHRINYGFYKLYYKPP